MQQKEIRACVSDVQMRAKDGGTKVAAGYAAKFGVLSDDFGGFKERIMPTAFDNVLDDDVRVYFNHDHNKILGRTKSGTARIHVDETGLHYDFDIPNTTVGRDLEELMERGDITQSSFAFVSDHSAEKLVKDPDGTLVREIHNVLALYDVSPVSHPAYPDATVGKRSFEKLKETLTGGKVQAQASLDHAHASLTLAKIREQS